MRHSQETAGLVLVVEDNRNISEMIGEYLEGRGFEVDYATDGLDGYRLAVENSYDVLVLDLMLPRLDGMEVCKRLRNEARTLGAGPRTRPVFTQDGTGRFAVTGGAVTLTRSIPEALVSDAFAALAAIDQEGL